MKRFWIATGIMLPIIFILWGVLSGSQRMWIVSAVWAVYGIIFFSGVAFLQLQLFCPAICRGKKGGNRVALTFDDGPDPRVTPQLLDLLGEEKVLAAFFCIGKKVQAHPQLAARIAAEGHLLANHTFRHKWWTIFLWRRWLVEEIEKTQEAIEQAAGVRPRFMRPPIGLTNPHYAGAMRITGLKLVGWSVRSLENLFSPDKVIERIRRGSDDGGIILLHDGGMQPDRLMAIVRQAIRDLRARGLEFERLDRLIA